MPDSLPIRDAAVYLYHADAPGRYSQNGESLPRLAGTMHTNVAGGFTVDSVLPGQAEGFAHIHFRVEGQNLASALGTLSLARSHGAGSDTVYKHIPWIVELPSASWAEVQRRRVRPPTTGRSS